MLRKGTVVAKVGENELMLEDIEGLTTGATTPDDSVQILKGFVNNWIKDQLLNQEATKSMPQDMDIERLVKDYRNSLVQNNYIEELVSKELDTMITDSQKQEYYEQNKAQYVLSESIVKYLLVKLNEKDGNLKNFEKLWKEGDYEPAKDLVKNSALFMQDQSNKWVPASEITSLIKSSILRPSDINKSLKTVKDDGSAKYFVKVFEYVGKDEAPPLDYIEGKISSIILNERKGDLVKRKKQLLFDQYYNTSKAKSFVE